MRRLPLPESVPPGIEVWLLPLDLNMPLSKRDLALLNRDERSHALRFRRHEDRVRSVMARAALRQILSSRTGVLPDKLRFFVNDYGKPSVVGNWGLEFNISHSGCFALIALSTSGQVGVDIECRDRDLDIEELSMHVFSPLERRSGLQTTEAFFDRWVAKESVLKALGLGISQHLQVLSILPRDNAGYEIVHDQPEWADVSAWPIKAPDNYAAALAWKSRQDGKCARSSPVALQTVGSRLEAS
ncbi:4'-phosphopantetheinyl transferase family protein [Nitrosospira sp. Is2]|uniref:4'-phosphopantetheinyl transferase family protein n=1 Tax=Nitrosospira sp. Is2 TaxID=3080532 RepID=UPI0029539A4A|nr:4'-phosphopantetheinyl transferase superfamily protein [Nitrosospira sp. Is2]WON74762.1 4'-phosphopantetheinyl transferase superfamily protein [Nitrosospira sp. Is2]